MSLLRKCHDQIQINVLALAGRLELAWVNPHDLYDLCVRGVRRLIVHVLALRRIPAALCSALGSSLDSCVRVRHDLKGFFSRKTVDS